MSAEWIEEDDTTPLLPIDASFYHKLAEIFIAVLIGNFDGARWAIVVLQLVQFIASLFIEFDKNIMGERMLNLQSDAGRAENKTFLALILYQTKRTEERLIISIPSFFLSDFCRAGACESIDIHISFEALLS